MVQSTGPANAEYLRSLVLGDKQNGTSREETEQPVGQRRRLASTRWNAAAQYALTVSLSASCNDLSRLNIEDENNILVKTKDAVITLRGVLEGKHDQDIDETLNYYQVPRDSWWSSLHRIIEGTFLIILHLQNLNLNILQTNK